MPKPTYEVLAALVESYINIRSSEWKLSENEPFTLPTELKPARKIEACIQLLQMFQKEKTLNGWIKIVENISVLEQKEVTERAAEDASIFHFIYNLFKETSPLLLETLKAIKSYILSQLKSESEFIKVKENLIKDIAMLEDEILDGRKANASKEIIAGKQKRLDDMKDRLNMLDDSKDHLTPYFNDVIKLRDPQTKKLKLQDTNFKEDTFKDFEANVSHHVRTRKWTKIVLTSHDLTSDNLIQKVLVDASTVTPAVKPPIVVATPVAPVIVAPAPVVVAPKVEKKPEEKKAVEAKPEVKKQVEPVINVPMTRAATAALAEQQKAVLPSSSALGTQSTFAPVTVKPVKAATKQHTTASSRYDEDLYQPSYSKYKYS